MKSTFRLHVAVHKLLIVSVLQGVGDLPDVGDDGFEWDARVFGVALAHCAVGRVLHDEKWHALLHIKQ